MADLGRYEGSVGWGEVPFINALHLPPEKFFQNAKFTNYDFRNQISRFVGKCQESAVSTLSTYTGICDAYPND